MSEFPKMLYSPHGSRIVDGPEAEAAARAAGFYTKGEQADAPPAPPADPTTPPVAATSETTTTDLTDDEQAEAERATAQYATTVPNVVAAVSAQTDSAILERVRDRELANPKVPGGRRGVLNAIAERLLQLEP